MHQMALYLNNNSQIKDSRTELYVKNNFLTFVLPANFFSRFDPTKLSSQ